MILGGATGVGKTEIAIEVAKRINGEIISADSVQLYKNCNIGSNKPTASQLREVPHHLVGILDVGTDPCSAVQFATKARAATEVTILNSSSLEFQRILYQEGKFP
jgi:tRNA dimethylallyltransferase